MKPVLVTFTWCVHMITEPGPLSSLCISRPSPSCFCLSRWIRMWACTGRAVILEPPGGQCCLLQFELQEITDQRGLSGQTRPHLVFCGLHCCTNQRRHPLTQNNNTSQVMKNAFLFDIARWVWPLCPVARPQEHQPLPELFLSWLGAPSAPPPSEATWRWARLDGADAPTHADLCPAARANKQKEAKVKRSPLQSY